MNKSAEDEMYNEMMSSLIQMVTQPLQFSIPMNSSENELSAVEKVEEGMSIGEESNAFEFENNYIINEGNEENGNKFDQSFNQRGAVTERNLQSNNSICRVGNIMEKEEKDKMNNYAHIMERERQQWGLWNLVRGPTEGPLQVQYGTKDLWKNIFNWRAYTFKNRNIIVVHENMDL